MTQREKHNENFRDFLKTSNSPSLLDLIAFTQKNSLTESKDSKKRNEIN